MIWGADVGTAASRRHDAELATHTAAAAAVSTQILSEWSILRFSDRRPITLQQNAEPPLEWALPDSDQLPPTFRGVRDRCTKPRFVDVRHGWWVSGFGGRFGLADAASASGSAGASAAAAAFARAALAAFSSFSRQHCLYLRPDPQ